MTSPGLSGFQALLIAFNILRHKAEMTMTAQYFRILFAMGKFTLLFKEYKIKPWHFFPLLINIKKLCMFPCKTCFDFVCKLICRLHYIMLHLDFDIILAAVIVDLKDLQKSIN